MFGLFLFSSFSFLYEWHNSVLLPKINTTGCQIAATSGPQGGSNARLYPCDAEQSTCAWHKHHWDPVCAASWFQFICYSESLMQMAFICHLMSRLLSFFIYKDFKVTYVCHSQAFIVLVEESWLLSNAFELITIGLKSIRQSGLLFWIRCKCCVYIEIIEFIVFNSKSVAGKNLIMKKK